jgi:hypothetical protein
MRASLIRFASGKIVRVGPNQGLQPTAVPLPKTTNQFMSNALGTDFSHVRIHNESRATNLFDFIVDMDKK